MAGFRRRRGFEAVRGFCCWRRQAMRHCRESQRAAPINSCESATRRYACSRCGRIGTIILNSAPPVCGTSNSFSCREIRFRCVSQRRIVCGLMRAGTNVPADCTAGPSEGPIAGGQCGRPGNTKCSAHRGSYESPGILIGLSYGAGCPSISRCE